MLGRLTGLLALVLLAGCGEREPAKAAPAPAAAAPAAISAPDPLSIRPTGVGPLGDGTPFDQALVQRAFPGATVESTFLHESDEGRPLLNVLANGTQTLSIEADPAVKLIESITVTGGDFVAPGGEKIMTRWVDAGFTLDDCTMGSDRQIHALVCRKAGVPEIVYVFGIPGWVSSEPPPPETLADKAFVREIIWTAPPRSP